MYYNERLYHPHNFERRRVSRSYRVSSTAFMAGFIADLRDNSEHELGWLEKGRVRSEAEANILIEWVNNPWRVSKCNSLLNIQGIHDTVQRMTYVPSNLGKGVVFYFICSACERRVKYLYMQKDGSMFRCRECFRLRYPIWITDVEPEAKRLNLKELL